MREQKKASLFIDIPLGFAIGGLMAIALHFLDDALYRTGAELGIIFFVAALPFLEELFKYLPLESSLFKANYIFIGLAVGLAFGLVESFVYVYSFLNQLGGTIFLHRIGATVLHIATGGIMGFFVSKRRGIIGFLVALALHYLFNFYIGFK